MTIVILCVCVPADVVLFCALTELQLSLYRKIVSSRAVKSCISDYYVSDAAQHLCCISALKKLCNHPDLLYRIALDNATGDSVSEGCDVNVKFVYNYFRFKQRLFSFSVIG